MQITACKPKSCERWLNILLQNLTQTGSWTREVHWTRTILSQNILVTNPAKRFVHVFFLHSVYLHKRSSTLIKDWTRLSNTIHRLKLNLFEKPILINTWSRIFQRYLTVLQIFFFFTAHIPELLNDMATNLGVVSRWFKGVKVTSPW